jgi:hypothetical protein
MHIGDTHSRFGRVSERMVRGVKSRGVVGEVTPRR